MLETTKQRALAGSRRRGITAIEVLVAVVLFLMVVGILLISIPRMRESANRVQCANNLKEIGTGCHLFRDAKKFLPASRIADGYATWAVQIVPYLKLAKDNRLNDWDLSKTYDDQPDEVRAGQVLLYYCPSRRLPPQLSSGEFSGALGDYAGCSGNGSPAHPWQTAKANGAFIVGEVRKKADGRILDWRGRVDLGDLARGQAQTVLLGEKHVPLGQIGQQQAGDGSLYNGASPASSARVGGPGYGLATGPDAPFHDNFGSYHPGICQLLMADNSVRAMAISIDEDVLGRLTTREP